MKQFKDPIYGYIDVPKDLVKKVIDTPEFQRLRYIKQTSYLPVYSAALHNRFVHSLGVYFLGVKASNALKKHSKKILEQNAISSHKIEVFQLACLLHDVGHAPFSHSGENFFGDGAVDLKSVVNDQSFSDDVDYYHKNGKKAAPHEIMSVIVALKQFPTLFFENDDKSFFARCITGYKYRDYNENETHAVLNAFVSLLNSTTIDVDRLDYLIRDAYVMGYNSISIDYDRLLNNVVIVEEPAIQLGYRKSALSVIENVIYAHDSEKKWIQNHPVILYEVFLIQQLLSEVISSYKRKTGKDLFSLESLLPRKAQEQEQNVFEIHINNILDEIGQKIKSAKEAETEWMLQMRERLQSLLYDKEISLLCDDDIIHLAKDLDSSTSRELFDRNMRRHPVWKSESEYKIYMDGFVGKEVYDDLRLQVSLLNNFICNESPTHSLSQASIDFCENELKSISKAGLSKADENNMKTRYGILLNWMNMFKELAVKQGESDFDVIVIPATNFESSFKKEDLGNTPIFIPETGKSHCLKEMINIFSVKEIERHNFFYVYSRKGKQTTSAQTLGKEIARLILDNQ